MNTSLDCLVCFLRQALDAARMISSDAMVQEQIMREVMAWTARMDLGAPPPVVGQRIHRRLRELTGVKDPYQAVKDQGNRMALALLPDLEASVAKARDPLDMALRLALAGNVIDMGVNSSVSPADLAAAVRQAMTASIQGSLEEFRKAADEARTILYLADNAGEIVFDRLLIAQLGPERVTVAVRGGPVINDATLADAEAAGLRQMVRVIDNGSDAPGTLLHDCSEAFRRQFESADLIVAKGQGNFETLSQEACTLFFLFKVKCPVIASHVGFPVGTHVLTTPRTEALPTATQQKGGA
jgi:uncharacterized protein with ATP-grasp and redox domains